MRLPIAATLAALAAAATPSSVAAAELDLPRAVELAFANNPALAAAREVGREVEGGIVEAKADAFPQIALDSSWGQSRSPSLLNSPDFEDIIEQFPGGSFEPSTQELSRAVIEITQPIWTFGKVGAAIDLAELVADAAGAQISTAELDTAAAVAEAYYRLLAAREGLATIEADREFRRRDLERVASLLEIGEATELEQLRAEAALVEVEPEVAARQGQVAVAETTLRRLLALPAGEPLTLVEVGGELADPPAIEALVEAGLASRPELADLDLQVAIYEKRQTITRAEGKPQVEFTGHWGREVREIENVDDPLYSAWAFGVGLRWEFFDGGRRRGQVAQLESQRRQTELRLEDLRATIRLEIDQARTDYRTATARADAARASAAAAREALRVARESYEQGVANQTDLLDAQSRATQAETVAVSSFYEALIQASRLARAVGKLPTAGWSPSPED
jgi:HAE1 family hydrophobic/amphiphilic exporter-1